MFSTKEKAIFKIIGKSFLGFLIIFFVLNRNIKYVNLDSQPKYDRIISTKKLSLAKIKKSNLATKKNISQTTSSFEKDKYLLSIVDYALKQQHPSAEKINFNFSKLCSYYSFRCSKINISKEFSQKQRTIYLAETVFLLNFIKKYLPKLSSTLEIISIQPEKIGRRGYAGHYSVSINVKQNMSYHEFFQVLTHEMGHIVDLGVLQGKSYFKSKNFTEFGEVEFSIDDPSLKFYSLSWKSEKIKKANAFSEDFVSGYGMTDPFEDFAESFNMYLNHNFVFRQMAMESNILRKKYNFLAQLFKGHYIFSDKNFNYSYGFRPWDSTKLK